MTFDLIVSQGRIADRTPGALPGARLTAEAIAPLLDADPVFLGQPADAETDDWTTSLPAASQTITAIQSEITESLARKNTPVLIANTCSASLATLPVVARKIPDAIVLWIDAHGDFNTPATTQSGYLGGMVLAAACGLWESGHGAGLRPGNVLLIGGRDIDPQERELLQSAGVRIFSPADATANAVLEAIGDAPIWIHVDWDVMEPGHVPAAYKVAGGFLPADLRAIFERLPKSRIAGIELAEFEASHDAAANELALTVITDIVRPLLGA